MKTALLALTTFATACTDADTVDLACESLPGSSRLHGFVLDERGGAPVGNAFVEIHTVADRTLLGSTVTGDDGTYAMAATTPLPSVRHAQAPSYLQAFAYDPSPRFDDALPLPMLRNDDADALSLLAGIERDPTTAMILVIALDCANHPIEGATVQATGAAGVLYLATDTRFDPALSATSTNSAALLVNVPAGPVDVTIEVDGQVSTTTIESRPNALTTTWGR